MTAVIKHCMNCYFGSLHHTIGTTNYIKCKNGQNQHPERATAQKYDDGIILPAVLELPCWEPKKD